MTTREIHGVRVLDVEVDGPTLGSERDAADLVGASYSERALLICIPVQRLDPDFFRLRTGMAGAFIQKLINYRRRLAVLGDISAWISESNAFRDFVFEANKGRDVWFVADRAELESKLGAEASS